MRKINFELLKNDEIIINKFNIKYIDNNKLTFFINKDKYIYYNNILEKSNGKDLIVLDFNNNICKVYIKEHEDYLPIKINVIETKKEDNIISIKYEIESEENILNIIRIEYI